MGGSSVHLVAILGKAREAQGLGACPPWKIFDFRRPEIVSGAVLG